MLVGVGWFQIAKFLHELIRGIKELNGLESLWRIFIRIFILEEAMDRRAFVWFSRRLVSGVSRESPIKFISDHLKLNISWTDILTVLFLLSFTSLVFTFEKNCRLSVFSTIFAKAKLDRFLNNIELFEQTTDIVESCFEWDSSNL